MPHGDMTPRAFDYHRVKKLALAYQSRRPGLIAFVLASAGIKPNEYVNLRKTERAMQHIVSTVHESHRYEHGHSTVHIVENPSTQYLTSVFPRLQAGDRLIAIYDSTETCAQDGETLDRFNLVITLRDCDAIIYYFQNTPDKPGLHARPRHLNETCVRNKPTQEIELDGLNDNMLALHAYDVAARRETSTDAS